MKNSSLMALAAILLGLAVALGAFGAHGLEPKLSARAFATYSTGVTYHFYHALALLALGASSLTWARLKWPVILILVGLGFFSGFCYLYALSGQKTFAMLVPIGGVSFIIAWIVLAIGLWRQR